jgi:hypothetical protein
MCNIKPGCKQLQRPQFHGWNQDIVHWLLHHNCEACSLTRAGIGTSRRRYTQL